MIRIIESSDLKASNIDNFIARSSQQIEEIRSDVEKIIDEVKKNGDKALIKFTQTFDKVELKKDELLVTKEEINEAYEKVNQKLVDSLKLAIKNITKFQEAQRKDPWFLELYKGVKAGQIYRPIEKIGIYIPGGRAVYPSTVLMAACPAKVAKVNEIVICSPPNKEKKIDPSILIAANECGIDTIYKIGGVQAIAAMAYGTESVKRVYKIFGPGNKWVMAAKKKVSNDIAIDLIAGPSEILIIADESANYKYVIADLLSQVEHDPENIGIIITHSEKLIDQIQGKIGEYVQNYKRKNIISEALEKKGLIIKTSSLEESINLSNLIAPEHLELLVKNPQNFLEKILNAGAIFLGQYSPVPLGDYTAGTNHILPTGGTAKMYSGLNIFDFFKIIDVLECDINGIKYLAKPSGIIAEFEGLYGHKRAINLRLK
jgi:histidinol dehydrogenase